MKRLAASIGIVGLSLLAMGAFFRKPAIDVIAQNKSQVELNEVCIQFGKSNCEFGVVIPGTSAGYLYYPHPITPDAELSWLEGERKQVRKIDLRKIYPKGKSGKLTFTVFPDRVEVIFKEKPWTR